MYSKISFDISSVKFLKIIIFSVGLLVIALSTVAWHLYNGIRKLEEKIVTLQRDNAELVKACEELKLAASKDLLEPCNQILGQTQISNPEILKIFLWSVVIIATFLGCSYLVTFFLKSTLVGKALVGKVLVGLNAFTYDAVHYYFGVGNFIKSFSVFFGDFELKIDLRSNDTCAISYRIAPDYIFEPFEHFLGLNQELLGKFNSLQLQKALEKSDIDSIVSSASSVLNNINSNMPGESSSLNSTIGKNNLNVGSETVNIDLVLDKSNNLDTVVGNTSPEMLNLLEALQNILT